MNRRWFSNALVDAVEHVVERVGQVLQLVVGTLEVDAARQVGGADVPGHVGDAVDRAQRPGPDSTQPTPRLTPGTARRAR